MNLQITNESRTNNHAAIEVSNGRKSTYIGKGKSGMINVCMMNASHRAWRGAGRSFRSFEEASEAYKIGFMKAAISLAEERL